MPSDINSVIVLCRQAPSFSEINARKVAEFMGADAAVVSLTGEQDFDTIRDLVSGCAALIVHANTLAQIATAPRGIEELRTLIGVAPHTFVYGFEASDRHSAILQSLSAQGLLRVEAHPNEDAMFEVTAGHREWCEQFSGLSIRGFDASRDASFIDGVVRDGQHVLVRAAGRPFFVRIEHEKTSLFFSACSDLANLDEMVPGEAGLLLWFSRLIPLMIFLRAVLGDRLWHRESSQACFIIDDPPLKRRYGFLEYARLLDVMSQQKFSASIAFIPWNYRRSCEQVARFFSAKQASLSLCIHGCDHTGAEFAATDSDLLQSKGRLAIDRMKIQAERLGVPFDEVMVFPQGLFSADALHALQSCGYVAAVNTQLLPANMSNALKLRDLLDVAVTAFGGVPLFVRHYPRDPAEFALDLFLGKPALIVEHHGYFRNGYEELERFVAQLNALDDRLEWRNLAAICSSAYLQKLSPGGDIWIRFYADRFRLANHGARTQSYLLMRPGAAGASDLVVRVNGHLCAKEQDGGDLKIRVRLNPGQAAEIIISGERHQRANGLLWRPTPIYSAKVLVRRSLSEFRDNCIETNRVLRELFSGALRFRRATKRAPGGAPSHEARSQHVVN